MPHPFEFFMLFYGLLLGLAVAELFAGLGNLLREKARPSFGILTPLLTAVVLIEIIVNFIDAWVWLQHIRVSLGHIVRPTLIGITYFALAAIVIPRDKADWADLDGYFMDRRRRFAGLLILCNVLIAIPEIPVELAAWRIGDYREIALYLAGNLWLFGAYVLLFFGKSRTGAIISLVGAIAYYCVYYREDLAGIFAYPASA